MTMMTMIVKISTAKAVMTIQHDGDDGHAVDDRDHGESDHSEDSGDDDDADDSHVATGSRSS